MEDQRINNDIIKVAVSHSFWKALCAKVSTLKECHRHSGRGPVNFILFRGLNHRQFRQLLLQREICIEICFISAVYVGLVEVKMLRGVYILKRKNSKLLLKKNINATEFRNQEWVPNLVFLVNFNLAFGQPEFAASEKASIDT